MMMMMIMIMVVIWTAMAVAVGMGMGMGWGLQAGKVSICRRTVSTSQGFAFEKSWMIDD